MRNRQFAPSTRAWIVKEMCAEINMCRLKRWAGIEVNGDLAPTDSVYILRGKGMGMNRICWRCAMDGRRCKKSDRI